MTRTSLAIAAALFAATTFLSSGANACISCNYVPEVVNTPVYSHGAKSYSKSYSKKRVYQAAKKKARPAKRQIVETETKARKVETAKVVEPKVVEPEVVETEVETENSTISTASVDKGEAGEPKAAASPEPKVSKAVGCKKFFPTVGMTLTVPCE